MFCLLNNGIGITSLPSAVIKRRHIGHSQSSLTWLLKPQQSNSTVRKWELLGTNISSNLATTKTPCQQSQCPIKIKTLPPFRSFRTTSPRQLIPPVLLMILSNGGKIAAAFIGVRVRKWWVELPAEQKTEYVGRMKGNRKFLYGLLALSIIGSTTFYEMHKQETPITKRSRFVVFTDTHIDEISRNEKNRLLETYKNHLLPPTDPKHKWVYTVAQKLMEGNKDLLNLHGKNKDWTISVIDDDAVNGFVLSCGSIFVFSGLLAICDGNDSALGIILAHELSHVLLNHAAEQASFLHLLDFLVIVPILAAKAFVPWDTVVGFAEKAMSWLTDKFICMPYGRSVEAEADEVGLMLAARACFDVRECLIWKKMEILNGDNVEDGEVTSINVKWFETHPSAEYRYEILQRKLTEAMHVREECKCPALPFLDVEKKMKQLEQMAKPLPAKKEVLAVPLEIK